MGPKEFVRLGRRLGQDLLGVASITSVPNFARYLANIVATAPNIARLRALTPADARMANRPCHFTVMGTRITLPGEDFAGAREMYARRVYFALPHFRINPGDIVVDAGANRGLFTVFAANVAQRVLAIEAQSGFLDAIRARLAMNASPASVDLECAIIGGATGAIADERVLTSSSHYEGMPPPRLSLDEILARHSIGSIDFLKLDIEGSEFDLFSSARRWLDCVSKVAMEVHPGFGDPRDLVTVLTAAGMQTVAFDGDLRRQESAGSNSGYLYAWRGDAVRSR